VGLAALVAVSLLHTAQVVLVESGIVRSDIRSSFGSASGTADGRRPGKGQRSPRGSLLEVCAMFWKATTSSGASTLAGG
jgi:hypothetical protein